MIPSENQTLFPQIVMISWMLKASMPEDSDSFEARWRRRFLEAVVK
jgi:hypothetical protein